MIFAISGAQGQGKSTTLNALAERGYKVIPNKTARTILARYGKTLNEVYMDKDLTVKFHDTILNDHAEYCVQHSNSDGVAFIERSYADIFSYALSVLGPFNEYSDWLNDFYVRCRLLQTGFRGTYYLTGRVISPESDGVRSTNIHFSNNLDKLICNTLTDFAIYNSSDATIITNPDMLERVDAIAKDMEKYNAN